ncbi:phenylpyruvate tautomerase PptA (4-oxalocrotonate tautomerase family) [Oxalobacteraceae bacterium GrIS 1.11]
MPFIRIALIEGKSPDYLRALSERVHQALVDTFEVPANDRFQVIDQYQAHELLFDRHYMGGPRSDDYVLISVTAGRVRSAATKQAFYQRLVALLGATPGLRPEDVMVIIHTTGSEDWSFGAGNAGLGAAPNNC